MCPQDIKNIDFVVDELDVDSAVNVPLELFDSYAVCEPAGAPLYEVLRKIDSAYPNNVKMVRNMYKDTADSKLTSPIWVGVYIPTANIIIQKGKRIEFFVIINMDKPTTIDMDEYDVGTIPPNEIYYKYEYPV